MRRAGWATDKTSLGKWLRRSSVMEEPSDQIQLLVAKTRGLEQMLKAVVESHGQNQWEQRHLRRSWTAWARTDSGHHRREHHAVAEALQNTLYLPPMGLRR